MPPEPPPSSTAGTYYELLGVAPQATAMELKSAYRKRMREVHPDVRGSTRDSEEQARALNQAYDVLSDSLRRARYDTFLRHARRTGVFRHAGPTHANSADTGWGEVLMGVGVAVSALAFFGGVVAAMARAAAPKTPP